MKRIIFILFFATSLYACTKKTESEVIVCPAMREKIDTSDTNCTCEPYIDKFDWKGKIVYVRLTAGPACLSAPIYYNEDGTDLTLPSNYTFDNFSAEAVFIKRVWTCKTGYNLSL